jgi:aspartyl protease family protein
MDLRSFWENLAAVIAGMPRSGLLMATLAAVLLGVAGSFVLRPAPAFGRLMRNVATLALAGILVLVVLQLSRLDPRFEMALPQIGLPEQQVVGGATRIPLAPDGHFWVRARINGVPAAFMIDTGASITTLNPDTAGAAGLTPRRGGIPIMMQTANGSVAAQIATIDTLSFGNIEASGLDAAIAPNLGPTNVIGMNLLGRLYSWRVEKNVMIMEPETLAPASTAARN